MPNWCNNYIQISGTKENMEKIYHLFKNEDSKRYREILVMNYLIPHDTEYKQIEKSGNFLLNPQTKFYGTKWDFRLNEANIHIVEEDRVSLAPATAWSPPSEFCERLARKYDVNVEITYEEGGVGFVGREVYNSDGLIEQEIYENYEEGLYNLENETFWENLDSSIEYALENEEDLEDFMGRYYFVTPEDKQEIEKLYTEMVKDYE
jgi:hypothetical protein